MNRREFIGVVIGTAVACVAPTAAHPLPMQSLYSNGDGELVAANSPEDASQYYDVDLGGLPLDADDWCQVNDDKPTPVRQEDDTIVTKTALEWASECFEPTCVATTNY